MDMIIKTLIMMMMMMYTHPKYINDWWQQHTIPGKTPLWFFTLSINSPTPISLGEGWFGWLGCIGMGWSTCTYGWWNAFSMLLNGRVLFRRIKKTKFSEGTQSTLKEKLPQAFIQIGWMDDDFRNLTAKVWANLDNPIKRYHDFSKVSLILCMSPSQVALF